MATDLDTEFMSVEREDYCIVLSSKEAPYVLNQQANLFLSRANNILVYAESIELSSSIKLPGKNIALVCHELRLAGTDSVTIDVSGTNGSPQLPKAVGNGDTGINGQDSGKVFISVESPGADLARLHVRAYGGDGGRGGSTSDPTDTSKGGAGGKGGDAGKITILFNNTVHEVRRLFDRRIRMAASAAWYDKIMIARDSIPEQMLPSLIIPSIRFLAAVGGALVSGILEAELSEQLSQKLRTDLSEFSQLEIFTEVMELLKAKSGANDLKAELNSALSHFTQKALEDQWLELSNEEGRLRQEFSQRLKSGPGNGGRGGASSSDLKAGGVPGVDGQSVDREKESRYLPLPGDKYIFDLDYPTFFPDECRMLLKRADVEFMRNTKESVDLATQIYDRLLQRLYCVPDLASPAKNSTPLSRLFTETFEKFSICLTPFSELQGILDEAKSRFARIQLGQDMFGHSPIWAPRLSYFYYEKRIGEMITDYKSLTKELENYRTKSDKIEEQREAVANVRDLIQRESASVQARLDAILNENGPLRATAYRVRSYDPKMKDQQRNLKAKMQDVADQIKQSVNVNKLINAFTTLASSSNQADAAKNSLKAGYSIYQSLTVVDDADGQSFDKALLVKQISSCGDTLESLSQAVLAGAEDSVALEDPGAVKVVTTNENISKMLDQFRNVLPQSIRSDTKQMLEDFLKTVTIRNNAVIEYNALLHSVQELQSMKKQQATTIEALSEQKLQKVDPNLPSVVNWLRKTRDDFCMAIMLYLNYASRAIRYWGLFDGLPLDKPGPLRGAVELEKIQRSLKDNFDACLNDYAAKSWGTFGSENSLGNVYKLNSQELETLIKDAKVEKGKKVYSVDITLSPDSAAMAGIGTSVRIHQIRLWLANAYVNPASDDSGRQILTMTLTHTGTETIKKDDEKIFDFVHSPVKISFRYHCGQVKSLNDAKAAAVYGQQIIENDFRAPTVSNADASSIAPLGPFTMWTAVIRESDNPGLDLSKVNGAWLEFWGRSKA